MADKKISQLTGASTPLAGTEVLPIVQSGNTVKVAVSDLTAGRAVSAASLTVSGDITADTSTFKVDAANNRVGFGTASPEYLNHTSLTSATTNAPISPVGVTAKSSGTAANGFGIQFENTAQASDGSAYAQTLVTSIWTDATAATRSSKYAIWTRNNGGALTEQFSVGPTGNITAATGNLVVGTAAKGIDFSANTHAAGMTSELLDWYEEGTWTPAYAPATGAFDSVTYDTAVTGGKYTRIGNMVHVQGSIRTDAITVGTASGQVYITGLPFAAASNTTGQDSWSTLTIGQATAWLGDVPSVGSIVAGQSRFELQYRSAANGATIDLVVADMDTGADKNLMRFSATYVTA